MGYDSTFDLALLRISKINTPDGLVDFQEWLTANELVLEYVKLDRFKADDEGAEIGDEVQILGYPGYGGPSITLTKGYVSGFEQLEYEGVFLPYMIKTDAKVNPGNSGGAAFDFYDNFIGVPTAVSGGPGNIGYVVSLPIVNAFLNQILGEPIANDTGVCPDLVNGYLGDDGVCYCNPGFEWSDAIFACVPETGTSPGSGTTIIPAFLDDAYCEANVRPNSVFNSATGNCECKEGLVLMANECKPKPAPKYFIGTPRNRTDILNCLVISDSKQKTYWLRGHKTIRTASLRNKVCHASESEAIRLGYRRIK